MFFCNVKLGIFFGMFQWEIMCVNKPKYVAFMIFLDYFSPTFLRWRLKYRAFSLNFFSFVSLSITPAPTPLSLPFSVSVTSEEIYITVHQKY